jgi:hypothetical protein
VYKKRKHIFYISATILFFLDILTFSFFEYPYTYFIQSAYYSSLWFSCTFANYLYLLFLSFLTMLVTGLSYGYEMIFMLGAACLVMLFRKFFHHSVSIIYGVTLFFCLLNHYRAHGVLNFCSFAEVWTLVQIIVTISGVYVITQGYAKILQGKQGNRVGAIL